MRKKPYVEMVTIGAISMLKLFKNDTKRSLLRNRFEIKFSLALTLRRINLTMIGKQCQ